VTPTRIPTNKKPIIKTSLT